MTLTTANVLGNVGTTGHGLDSTVFLEFGIGQQSGDAATINRIMLRCTGINIGTNKRANATPIPFSGIITGESRSVVIDLGMVSKTVSLDGVIHEQVISRRHDKEADPIHRSMTAYEIAQLLHSSVDSSFLQENQNLDTLYILYPSRVGNDYNYHAGVTVTTEHSELPLIPFNWASRNKDETGTISALTTDFPDPSTPLSSIKGISGFIDNFSTQFQPGGLVTFSLTFNETVNLSLE